MKYGNVYENEDLFGEHVAGLEEPIQGFARQCTIEH